MDLAWLKQDRWLVRICGTGTVAFIVCYAVAIALYPGGTWSDANAVGHSWTRNYLCDLMQTEALDGTPAPLGSALARIGMWLMLVGLVAFYEMVERLEVPPTRAGRIARRAGVAACILGMAVPIITSGLWRLGHLIAVVAAFLPSLVATVAALVVCLRAPRVSWLVRTIAIITVASGALDGFGYLFVYTSPALGLVPESIETRVFIARSLPLLQRVATVGMLAWTLAMCAETARRARSGNARVRASRE